MPDTEPTLQDAFNDSWQDLLGEEPANPDEGSGDTEADNEPETTDPDADLDEPVEGEAEEDDPDAEEDPAAEDDDPDGEGDDEDGEEEDPDAASAVIELSEDDVIRLPNGEEVAVKDAVLFQKGATQKYQELAEQRKELESKEQVADEAIERYEEIAERYQTDPAGLVRDLIAQTDDPTYTFADALKRLAADVLDESFTKTFGLAIDRANELSEKGQENQRLSKVEEQLEAQQNAERQQALLQHYLNQWSEVKANHGLAFETPDQEREAWGAVLKFAHEAQIPDLRQAYKAYAFDQSGRQEPATPQRRNPAAQKRRRANRVVTRKGGAGAPAGGGTDKVPTVEEAFAASLAEIKAKRKA